MKISKPEHKNVLLNCFFENDPRTNELIPIQFQLEKLADAGSAKKKLVECVDKETNKLDDKEIEFSTSEMIILLELFKRKSKKGFVADDAEYVLSLQNILEGKEDGKKGGTKN